MKRMPASIEKDFSPPASLEAQSAQRDNFFHLSLRRRQMKISQPLRGKIYFS